VPFTHFAAFLLGAGFLVGGVLFLLDAPVWAYYLAPLVGIPFLIRALFVQDMIERGEWIVDDNPGVRRTRATTHTAVRANLVETGFSPAYRWELGLFRFVVVAVLSVAIASGGIGALTFAVKVVAGGALVPSLIAIVALTSVSLVAVLLRPRQMHRVPRGERSLGHSHQAP